MNTRQALFFLPLTAAVLLAGCDGAARQKTHPVSGTVKLNGEPLGDAHVVFHPTGDGGMIARGKTDSGGNYTLTTYDTGDGAIAGEYSVTFAQVDSSSDVVSAEVDLDDPGEMYGEMMGDEEGDALELENLLPAEYANPTATPETRSVQEGGGEFNFDLNPSS